MTTFTVMILVTSYILLAVALRESLRWKWTTRLYKMSKCDINRNRFGAVRTKLMEMAREEKIDINGSLFEMVYMSLTTFMREPEQYELAAGTILTISNTSEQKKEKISVGENEAKIVVELSRAIDLLCRDYFRYYRFLAWLLDSLGENTFLWVEVNKRRKKHIPKTLREATDKLEWLEKNRPRPCLAST